MKINYKKVALIILSSILVVVLLLVMIYVGAYQFGKNSLSKPVEIAAGMMTGTESGYEYLSYQGKEYQYCDNIINVLCLGVDKEEQLAIRNDVDNSVGQADAIFLVSLDVDKQEIRIIAIPRDTMVILQMYNSKGEYMGMRDGQLTLQYAYSDGMEKSAELMVGQVSSIMNQIPINAYVAINVHSLWTMNAAIGGVDITMDQDYTDINPAFVQGETVHLDDNLLENYIRGRNSEETGSAYTRISRQKQYMQAFFEKAKSVLKEDITLPLRLLETLEKDMKTDVTAVELVYLISEGLKCNFSEENMYSLPGEIIMGEVYEEYHLDKAAVEALVVELFYEER